MVTRLEQDLEALRREPPEMQALRKELGNLERSCASGGSSPTSRWARSGSGRSPAPLARADRPPRGRGRGRDYTKAQVRHALARYNGLLDRIDAARLERDNAQAAFKRRYVLIRPPQRPKGPVKPKVTLVLLASTVAGALLGLLAPSLVDLLSRKLVEPWQVEQLLGLSLLGEVRSL